ncbi:hypothetical protein RchiOBHm_Chr1g0334411 [Rosa chinensis]|uniref:Uncharacterized protein n=1 Tax=Rosa chinensis TaxID=74649 RepID=A0A2P6SC99_ROSCH|nr:hypothetical protein RchiOBHm_Chr1g0334411 [Rosa chinensis]
MIFVILMRDGLLYIVDRINEFIKHNGYQVAPAELEAILLSHLKFLMLLSYREVEDEEVGQIPMAYVVRAASTELITEDQVAPYKKVKKLGLYLPFQDQLQAKS